MTVSQQAGPTLIVGTGLMGTSIGLALSVAGRRVLLDDADPQAARAAAERGAGSMWTGQEVADVVVVAAPPSSVADLISGVLRQHVEATVIDIASVKSMAALEIDTVSQDLRRYVGTHPMAGAERGGPESARADLFIGRPWAVCPHEGSSADAISHAEALARDCGASVVRITPDEHDAAVALVSHLPQLTSSALAALVGQQAPAAAMSLVGAGLRDMTRIAASPAPLWVEILARNATRVAPLAAALGRQLVELGDALAASADAASGLVGDVLERGAQTVQAYPGKHSSPHAPTEEVLVLLEDAPGTLAALLADVGTAGVNVEDLRIEHASGAALGRAALSVPSGRGAGLVTQLGSLGWSASLAG